MPDESLLVTIYVIGAFLCLIIVHAIVIWSVYEDSPPGFSIYFSLIGGCLIWPPILLGFAGYGFYRQGKYFYTHKDFLRRKIKAKYWMYRARREEDA